MRILSKLAFCLLSFPLSFDKLSTPASIIMYFNFRSGTSLVEMHSLREFDITASRLTGQKMTNDTNYQETKRKSLRFRSKIGPYKKAKGAVNS